MIDTKKYLITFLITAAIFATAVFTSSILSEKKIENVRDIESRVATDILSSEVQFALLEETSCADIGPGFLSKELGPLGEKITYAENQAGFSEDDLASLKRSYFLLEIKDYLLMKRLTEKCGIKPTFTLYFYSSEEECKDCERMGHVLTFLREKYPDLRVYSFDYDFDIEAIKTLVSIYKVQDKMPALVINNKPYYGYYSVEDLEKNVPAFTRLAAEYEKAKALEARQPASGTTSTSSGR